LGQVEYLHSILGNFEQLYSLLVDFKQLRSKQIIEVLHWNFHTIRNNWENSNSLSHIW